MKEELINNEAAQIVSAVASKIEQTKTRSAWDRGVKDYAEELLDKLREGAEGGCALCYDGQIAERLCAPWELRKTDNGRKDPNPRETWIDVQSRALYQASRLVLDAAFPMV